MCGILGIAVANGDADAQLIGRVAQAVQSLRHRGPDAQGEYRGEGVLLGHTRLSILDLSEAGAQPMRSHDRRFAMTYNGEVYNFRELAAKHSLRDLRSGSDTEIVLRLFETLGPASLSQLNGMFAFAIHDTRARKLWLVRDRLGIKPLYYSLDPERLAFGSEIKAVRAMCPELTTCDVSTLHEWLYFGNSFGEHTLYRGVSQLLPGHFLELDLQTFEHSIHAYWTLEEAAATADRSFTTQEAIAETRRLLELAVQRQLVSDVPVGLFLSGGVDSSALAAFATRHYGRRLTTYSAGFDFARGSENELPKASRVANHFGTDHHELHIGGGEVGGLVERLVHHHDMPFADAANIPLALMAAEIASETKVVLQGDGGDELFCGYRRYFTLSHYALLRPMAQLARAALVVMPGSAFWARMRRYARALGAEDLSTSMALLLTAEDRATVPTAVFAQPVRRAVEASDPFARHRECLQRFVGQDSVNQMSFLDFLTTLPDTFLEKVDRSTMAASLEVRVPFLDHDLVDFAVRLPGTTKAPGGRQKWLLKQALEGIVPAEVLHGRKVGLTVPYDAWLQGALRPLFFDHLERFRRRNPAVLDVGRVQELYEQTGAGGRDDSFMLWKLMNLMIWANNSNIGFGEAVS